MGEMDDNDEASTPVDQTDDKFYFVDEERLKERLGGGDGPSFSVASLFSSKSASTHDAPSDQAKNVKSTVPAPVFTKQSLFILDPNDSRIADVGKFFDVQNPPVSAQEVQVRRREIHLIVKNKFKRAERNQEKFNTFGSNKFSKPRRKFKKRKT